MKRILVVEDEPVAVKALIDFLGRDYEVVATPSGDEAIKKLESTHFDLALLDLKIIGKITGQDILKKVRSDFPEMKVIVWSASSELLEACRDLKADAYLEKPAGPRDLRAKIKELLG